MSDLVIFGGDKRFNIGKGQEGFIGDFKLYQDSSDDKLKLTDADGNVAISVLDNGTDFANYFNGTITAQGDDTLIRVTNSAGTVRGILDIDTDNGRFRLRKSDGTWSVQLHSDGDSYFTGGSILIGTDTNNYEALGNNFVIYDSAASGLTIATGDTTQKCSIYFADGIVGSEKYRGLIQYDHSSDFMRVFVAGTEALRIISGNLLLGTTTPTGAKLDVAGDIYIDGNSITLHDDYPAYKWIPDSDSTSIGYFTFRNAANSATVFSMYYNWSADSFTFDGASGGYVFDGGSVLINTTTASGALLDVNGNIALTETATNRLLLPQNNDYSNPTLAFGDGDSGIFEYTDDSGVLKFNYLYFTGDLKGWNNGTACIRNTAPSATTPSIIPNYVYSSTGIGLAGANQLSMITNGVEAARFDTDATAGNTRFMLYDVDSGALVRVSVGAADSGGTGYKVLRIPN